MGTTYLRSTYPAAFFFYTRGALREKSGRFSSRPGSRSAAPQLILNGAWEPRGQLVQQGSPTQSANRARSLSYLSLAVASCQIVFLSVTRVPQRIGEKCNRVCARETSVILSYNMFNGNYTRTVAAVVGLPPIKLN